MIGNWIENESKIPIRDGLYYQQASGFVCGISLIVTQVSGNDYAVSAACFDKTEVLYGMPDMKVACETAFHRVLDTMKLFIRQFDGK
jgi:hypothetical protein